jgi:signal transduction histidine kinase
MPEGGELTFAASPLYVTDSIARSHPTRQEGLHVALTVRDTGRGMDPSVQARAFEPFFTTKDLSPEAMASAGVDLVIRKSVGLDELAKALQALLMREAGGPAAGDSNT